MPAYQSGRRVYWLLGLALFLAFESVWFLAPSLVATLKASTGMVANLQESDGQSAELAASIGVIRGELWTECASTYLSPLPIESSARASIEANDSVGRALKAAERAVRYSPHDARAWLDLAESALRLRQAGPRAATALKMSYYTGPNEVNLIPRRLVVSVGFDVFGDDELKQLLRHQIQSIVRLRPDLRPALIDAYRRALPTGKALIENAVSEIDANLLGQLRSTNPRP
jgi:hypothetical protein